MNGSSITLTELGWDSHFQEQVEFGDAVSFGRVGEVHREHVTVRATDGDIALAIGGDLSMGQIAVGDWVRFDAKKHLVLDILERKTSLRRRAAGTSDIEQLVAANVDTLFIVTSCNADFNVARLERYLTFAAAGDIEPVIVLTKADIGDGVDELRSKAESLSARARAVAINALDDTSVSKLLSYLPPGSTGALVGSSGVGKSTILNALTGAGIATQGIREDDAKGRHTTTARLLRRTHSGGWLIDTPGIRQLSLVDSSAAIDEVFSDVTDLFSECRFSDCAHKSEPGCAVHASIDAGRLDPDRFRRWSKLDLENQSKSETSKEARTRQKAFSKKVRTSVKARHRLKGN